MQLKALVKSALHKLYGPSSQSTEVPSIAPFLQSEPAADLGETNRSKFGNGNGDTSRLQQSTEETATKSADSVASTTDVLTAPAAAAPSATQNKSSALVMSNGSATQASSRDEKVQFGNGTEYESPALTKRSSAVLFSPLGSSREQRPEPAPQQPKSQQLPQTKVDDVNMHIEPDSGTTASTTSVRDLSATCQEFMDQDAAHRAAKCHPTSIDLLPSKNSTLVTNNTDSSCDDRGDTEAFASQTYKRKTTCDNRVQTRENNSDNYALSETDQQGDNPKRRKQSPPTGDNDIENNGDSRRSGVQQNIVAVDSKMILAQSPAVHTETTASSRVGGFKFSQLAFREARAVDEDDKATLELARSLNKDDFLNMKIVGQFNKGFIITRLGSDLFIIDQHAADEKFNFETMQKSTVIHRQKLFNAIEMEINVAGELVVLENLEILAANGFEFDVDKDASAGKRLRLKTIPFSKSTTFGEEDVYEMISMLTDRPGEMCRPSRVRSMLASRACRRAIMVGTALDRKQMRAVRPACTCLPIHVLCIVILSAFP
eukprot:SAG31_NODE_1302_length_8900_cov_4.460857_6_plen_544_part_00